jgi:hypothetical protein
MLRQIFKSSIHCCACMQQYRNRIGASAFVDALGK